MNLGKFRAQHPMARRVFGARFYTSARSILCGLILLMLGAPAPGAVGSCGAEDSAADLITFCRAREELTCWRRGLRLELSEEAVNQCRVDVIKECRQRVWAPECKPTQRQADACIYALRDVETVQTAENKLAECKTKRLCTAEGETDSGQTDGGDEP
jgi:hypothetical protein